MVKRWIGLAFRLCDLYYCYGTNATVTTDITTDATDATVTAGATGAPANSNVAAASNTEPLL